ncbi:2-C-methyl-D-erythritol 4-phosphate cytidylyltransferase [Elusimicrobiota bacterium]
MKLAAIIVAGGAGKRFGADKPKQFLLLNKKPMFEWSIIAFKKIKECVQVVLVVPKDKLQSMLKYKKLYGIDIVCGGKERFDSVKNGLNIVKDDISLVAVHDAARPLITEKIIKDVVESAEKFGGAIAAVASKDSVKFSKSGTRITKSLDRKTIWNAQTPQIFKKDILKKAYSKKISKSTTDDAQLVDKIGIKSALVFASYENFKITEQTDFLLAEVILKKRGR